jgi:hypothetical protein
MASCISVWIPHRPWLVSDALLFKFRYLKESLQAVQHNHARPPRAYTGPDSLGGYLQHAEARHVASISTHLRTLAECKTAKKTEEQKLGELDQKLQPEREMKRTPGMGMGEGEGV